MAQSVLLALNYDEIRERVLLEVRGCEQAGRPWHSAEDRVSRQIEFLIITYVALADDFGIGPYPDMLSNLGWPGEVLHVLFCRSAGMWEAFRRLVERSHNLPWRTSLTEGDVVLHSVQERVVYRGLVAMSGVTRVAVHPLIPAASGRKTADFLVTAITGLAIYVEVAMVGPQMDAERSFLAGYREDLLAKVEHYKEQGFDPVVIWADEVASPRLLAERLNDVRARLGLATRAPAPLAWYEEIG